MYNMHFDRYEELCKAFKIRRGTYGLVSPDAQYSVVGRREALEKAMESFDVVIEYVGPGYAHAKYRVLRNKPKLSTKDLAIICDEGNLCFGYRTEGDLIIVHTD